MELHNSNLVQKYLTDFATNNSNVWFFKHHALSDREKLDLIVFQIAEEIIQEGFDIFLMASLLG